MFLDLNYITFRDPNNHYPMLYFVRTTVLIYGAIASSAH